MCAVLPVFYYPFYPIAIASNALPGPATARLTPLPQVKQGWQHMHLVFSEASPWLERSGVTPSATPATVRRAPNRREVFAALLVHMGQADRSTRKDNTVKISKTREIDGAVPSEQVQFSTAVELAWQHGPLQP